MSREVDVGRNPEAYERIFIEQGDRTVGLVILSSVYGEKLGAEANNAVKNAREGASYRKNGGLLVRVVSKEETAEIREKETAIGMIQLS